MDYEVTVIAKVIVHSSDSKIPPDQWIKDAAWDKLVRDAKAIHSLEFEIAIKEEEE